MTPNCIWLWGSSSGALASEIYSFIATTPRSTQIWSGRISPGHFCGSNYWYQTVIVDSQWRNGQIPGPQPPCMYLPYPLHEQDATQGLFLCGIQSFSSSRPVAIPRLKSQVYPTILLIARGRIVGFMLFLRELILREMEIASSRDWTQVTVFIFYDDSHYTTSDLHVSEFEFQSRTNTLGKDTNPFILPAWG